MSDLRCSLSLRLASCVRLTHTVRVKSLCSAQEFAKAAKRATISEKELYEAITEIDMEPVRVGACLACPVATASRDWCPACGAEL